MLKTETYGPITRIHLARTVFGGPEGWMTRFSGGHFAKINLIRSLLDGETLPRS